MKKPLRDTVTNRFAKPGKLNDVLESIKDRFTGDQCAEMGVYDVDEQSARRRVYWEARASMIYTEEDGTPGKAVFILDMHPLSPEDVTAIVDAHNATI